MEGKKPVATSAREGFAKIISAKKLTPMMAMMGNDIRLRSTASKDIIEVMRRLLKRFVVHGCLLLTLFSGAAAVRAQILPSGKTESYRSCSEVQKVPQFKQALSNENAFKDFIKGAEILDISKNEALNFLLGCAIKTGKIRLFMVPFFMTYIIQFLLSIAGLVAVLFMVIGGYKYVVGGLTEDKESGKKTILHALVGFIVALSAWIVVNFIQVALTS